jgi:hypothetical protein
MHEIYVYVYRYVYRYVCRYAFGVYWVCVRVEFFDGLGVRVQGWGLGESEEGGLADLVGLIKDDDTLEVVLQPFLDLLEPESRAPGECTIGGAETRKIGGSGNVFLRVWGRGGWVRSGCCTSLWRSKV